jgi:hypothetical protein
LSHARRARPLRYRRSPDSRAAQAREGIAAGSMSLPACAFGVTRPRGKMTRSSPSAGQWRSLARASGFAASRAAGDYLVWVQTPLEALLNSRQTASLSSPVLMTCAALARCCIRCPAACLWSCVRASPGPEFC